MNIYTSEDKSSYMFSFAAAWAGREGRERTIFCAKVKTSHCVVVEIITQIPQPDQLYRACAFLQDEREGQKRQ